MFNAINIMITITNGLVAAIDSQNHGMKQPLVQPPISGESLYRKKTGWHSGCIPSSSCYLSMLPPLSHNTIVEYCLPHIACLCWKPLSNSSPAGNQTNSSEESSKPNIFGWCNRTPSVGCRGTVGHGIGLQRLLLRRNQLVSTSDWGWLPAPI